MLNRRQLRIKVLQALYAQLTGNDLDPIQAKKTLLGDVDKIYDIYLYYILVFPELLEFASRRIEENKNKRIPTKEDLNPNLKFVENKVFNAISESNLLRKIAEERKISWSSDEQQEMMRKLYYAVRESDVYQEYMSNDVSDFDKDKSFAKDVFKEIVANYEPILNFFEEKSVNWLDDIDMICKGVLKSFSQQKEGEEFEPEALHKDAKEDKEFVSDLFKKTISEYDDNLQLIDKLTSNWELDRIAKMDLILMSLAITELKGFSSIPKKVTLNEYIEISKFYSTPKSNGFINGVLDKAVAKLEKEGAIKKMGRGLMN